MLRTDSISDSRVGSFIPSSALAIVCATVQPYMANASLLFVRGEYFLIDGVVLLDRRVVGPLRVLGVLEVARGDDPLGVLEPDGREHERLGSADVVEDVQRLPVALGDRRDGLRGELRRRDVQERVGPGAREPADLRRDGRVGDVVALLVGDLDARSP